MMKTCLVILAVLANAVRLSGTNVHGADPEVLKPQRRAAEMWLAAIRREVTSDTHASGSLRVGVAEVDITPPVGFPMAGYYHERLADGVMTLGATHHPETAPPAVTRQVTAAVWVTVRSVLPERTEKGWHQVGGINLKLRGSGGSENS